MTSVAPEFAKTPPAGLRVPEDLIEFVRTRDRSRFILDHGPTRAEVKPGWWEERGIKITFPSEVDGEPALTRRDLFAMADEVGGLGEPFLGFLWHVLAWGSGDARRNNLKRIESCRTHVDLLRRAFDAARSGDRRRAYGALVRPGGATVPWLGPAFFSKFLYFASVDAPSACLILDARVARSLFLRGWNMAPTYPTRTFSFNWFTDTYVGYGELLETWAQRAGGQVTPDMFERALFEEGKG